MTRPPRRDPFLLPDKSFPVDCDLPGFEMLKASR